MSEAEQFREFAAGLGYELPANIEPGRRFRFSANGKRSDDAGWGIQFADGKGGVIGDWRTGAKHVWQAERDRTLSPAEYRELQAKIEREKREAEGEREREHAEAAARAMALLKAAKPSAPDHPYLQRKAIGPRDEVPEIAADEVLRILGYAPKQEGEALAGRLLIVPVKIEGKIASVEMIDESGRKSALYGGAKRGGYFGFGNEEDLKRSGRLCICEGYATAASVFEATGFPTAAAFTAGNLEAVARALRAKFASAQIIICADDDYRTAGNPGRTKATEAAEAIGALIAVPDFGANRPEGATDFNDLQRAHSPEAVTRAIAAAKPAQINGQTHSAGETHTQGWPLPEALPELPPVPAFNYEVLPGPLRAFVRDIAERMQCPPEFPAVGAVVMVGAAIGRRLGIRPKKFDSWTVVPNVWGMLVGKPGIMKSPALSESIAPLKRIQALAFEAYEAARSDYEISARAEKIREAEAEKKARAAYSKDRGANINAMLKPDIELEEPKPKRYVVNDTSPEQLCETLKDNPYGVLCERDELSGWLRSLDKEGNQEAKALYLTAADGDKSFTVDRIMRGSGRHIEGLCVSNVGSIQPGVLARYVKETQRGGAGDDGLLQRFGLMIYPDVSREWRNVDRAPDKGARDAVHALIERLCNLTAESAGAEFDTYSQIPFVRFSDTAQALFAEWQAELESRLRSGEDHPAVISHLAKYRKTVPALALINHVCDSGTGPISDSALGRALLFIELLEAHARRVYSYAARPDLDAAKTILAKLKAGKLPIEFSARHVYRAGWSGLTTVDEAGAALRVLMDFGYLRERTNTDTGGAPSTVYRAHPATKAPA